MWAALAFLAGGPLFAAVTQQPGTEWPFTRILPLEALGRIGFLSAMPWVAWTVFWFIGVWLGDTLRRRTASAPVYDTILPALWSAPLLLAMTAFEHSRVEPKANDFATMLSASAVRFWVEGWLILVLCRSLPRRRWAAAGVSVAGLAIILLEQALVRRDGMIVDVQRRFFLVLLALGIALAGQLVVRGNSYTVRSFWRRRTPENRRMSNRRRFGLAALAGAVTATLSLVGMVQFTVSGDPKAKSSNATFHPAWIEKESETVPRVLPLTSGTVTSDPRPGNRAVLVGLDGVDWRYITPMIEEGILPTFSRLVANGSYGNLKSDIAYSPISWTTIATGKGRERHGLVTGGEALFSYAATAEPVDIRVRRVWEMAYERDRSIFVLDYFFARPRNLGSASVIYQGSYLDLPTTLPAGSACREKSGRDVYEMVQCSEKGRGTDLTLMLDRSTDYQSHTALLGWFLRHTSRYIVPVEQRGDWSREDDGFTKGMIAIDKKLGLLWESLPPDTALMIVSDHGFGVPTGSVMEVRFGREFWSTLGAGDVDSENMDHVDLDLPLGRFSVDIDEQSVRYPLFRREGTAKTVDVRIHGDRAVFRPALVGVDDWQERLEKAITDRVGDVPWLTFQRGDGEWTVSVNPDDLIRAVMNRDGPWEPLLHVQFATATHSPPDDGILLMAGPGIRTGNRLYDARLEDVTPTLLYMLNLPVGRDMDGNVLTNAFTKTALSERSIQWIDTYETTPVERDAVRLSENPTTTNDMNLKMREQLKALGYLQ